MSTRRMKSSVSRRGQTFRVVMLAIALGLGYIFFLGDYSYLELYRTNHQVEQFEVRIEQLEQENRRLEGELLRLKSDPVHLEKEARTKLGLVSAGQILYKFRYPDSKPAN